MKFPKTWSSFIRPFVTNVLAVTEVRFAYKGLVFFGEPHFGTNTILVLFELKNTLASVVQSPTKV
jgi:hypothetical protein